MPKHATLTRRCRDCPSAVDVWETLTLFVGALLFAGSVLALATFGFLWLLQTGWGWAQ